MASFNSLDESLLSLIAQRCAVESAAQLCLTSKQLCASVQPLLPSLCDPKALRLVMPSEQGMRSAFDLSHIWWGLAYATKSGYSEILVSTLPGDSEGGYFEPKATSFTAVTYDSDAEEQETCQQSMQPGEVPISQVALELLVKEVWQDAKELKLRKLQSALENYLAPWSPSQGCKKSSSFSHQELIKQLDYSFVVSHLNKFTDYPLLNTKAHVDALLQGLGTLKYSENTVEVHPTLLVHPMFMCQQRDAKSVALHLLWHCEKFSDGTEYVVADNDGFFTHLRTVASGLFSDEDHVSREYVSTFFMP